MIGQISFPDIKDVLTKLRYAEEANLLFLPNLSELRLLPGPNANTVKYLSPMEGRKPARLRLMVGLTKSACALHDQGQPPKVVTDFGQECRTFSKCCECTGRSPRDAATSVVQISMDNYVEQVIR
jgi:hypothetical protein